MNALRTWLGASILRKALAAVALPLLLLGVSMLAIDRLERQNQRAEDDVRRTLQLLSDLHEAHSLLAETAAAVRGYRLIGQDNFLDPYRAAEPSLMGVVDRIGTQLADDEQRLRFRHVRPLFVDKLEGWRRLLDPTLSTAEEQRELIEGKAKLDILRAELRAMREHEIRELGERVEIAQALRQRNLMITQLAALAASLGAVVAVGVFTARLSRRARALEADAARLGDGGHVAPAAGSGGDELARVQRRLAQASALLAERDAEATRARDEAEAANRAKTDFLSRSSHELRTPLNAILGYAQVLQMDPASTAARGHVDHIASAGRHLLGLIGELLDIARIESGQLELDLATVPARAVVDEALALVAPDAQARGIRVESRVTAADGALLADRQRLRQVLVNLLGNAIKFNRAGGAVRVAAIRAGDSLRIEVEDEGPGLPPDRIERLFTPFERLGAERSAVEGTGLGLALSKRLMDAMDGTILVDSQPGRGSLFSVVLPVATGAEPASHDVHPAQPHVPAGPRHVLHVEDNPSNRALIDTLFARRPAWQLAHACTLEAARRAMQARRPDLVLLDMHMPDGHGDALVRDMAAVPALAGVPVVALSADATAATRERARAAGVADYLAKPVDVPAFFAVLDRHLG